MSWSSSDRDARFNPGWEKTRKAILERDGYACRRIVTDEFGLPCVCGRPANEVDHIRRARNGEADDDSPSNLEALCSWHHRQKTERESAEQRRENRQTRKEREWYSGAVFRMGAR